MLILPEYQKPYLIETSYSPVIPKYFWAFSGSMLDYTILPIAYLEETIGSVINISINGFEFVIPYTWFIMISDPDTLKLDYIPIIDCATTLSYALTMTPIDSKFRLASIEIKDVVENVSLVHPMLQKNTALCHPIAEIETDLKVKTIQNVIIGPHDLYKQIHEKSYGDLM